MRKLILLLCIPSLIDCLAVRHRELYPLPGEYVYSVPQESSDDLVTGTAAGTLFSTGKMQKLNEFFNLVKKGAFGEIHSVLLSYQGRLVVEEYFTGYRFHGPLTNFTASDTHNLASVTKSLTSLCVGIAIDKGYIKNLNQPFLDFYKEASVTDRESKKGITVRHLLTMTAGFSWDETTLPYTDLRNDVVRLHNSPDPLVFCLNRRVVTRPGEQWVYSGACPNLLGDIVRRASGLRLDQFALEFLYKPLGISQASWIMLRKDFVYASGDAQLRPRDMMKIGLMVQNYGTWNGKRLVSETWITQSMQHTAQAAEDMGYGFMWWLPELPGEAAADFGPVYMASGWGDQYIVIAPQQEVVLVVTGGNYAPPDPNQIPILSFMLEHLFLN